MTFLSALLNAVTDPTSPDELPSTYLAGYQDAYLEIRHRVLRLLETCPDDLYVLSATPTGLLFTRLSLRALDLAQAGVVRPPLPVAAPDLSDPLG